MSRLAKEIIFNGTQLRSFTECIGGIELTKRIFFYKERFYQIEQQFGYVTNCIEIVGD